MTDDELDDLRDREQTLLEELESVADEDARQEILSELEDLQDEIEEKEQEQTAYLATFMLDMLDEDERDDFGDNDFDFDL